jgi:hypothetical protein
MLRQCLPANPGLQAGLPGGLQGWGHPGLNPSLGDTRDAIGYRITEEDGPNGWEKWFEVGFIFPARLAGDASRGWVDPSGRCRLWAEWSEDLVAWSTVGFIDCAGSPTEVDDGWEYWCRSILPVDSVEKSGNIWCESTEASGDSRNNPFTSLTIAGVVQTLPNFPYEMPSDAAQLQTDLRAAGWTDATVAASSDVDWRIEIPDVDFVAYELLSEVGWPVYYVTDPLGSSNAVAGRSFGGGVVNGSGVLTYNPRQFMRLGISTL